jgi:hypothetical protein
MYALIVDELHDDDDREEKKKKKTVEYNIFCLLFIFILPSPFW